MAISRGRGDLFRPLAGAGRGPVRGSSVTAIGGGGHGEHFDAPPVGPVVSKADRTSTLPYQPAKGHGVSVSAMLQNKGKPGMSAVTNSRTGVRLNNAQVAGLGPLSHAGWDVQGMGSGGRIGSASGARNSKGIPKSDRGKVQRYIESGQAQASIDAAAAAGQAAAQKAGQSPTGTSGGASSPPASTLSPLPAKPAAPVATPAPAAKPTLPGLTPITAAVNWAQKLFAGGKPAAKPAPTRANSPALAAALDAADKAGPAPAVDAATAERIRGYRAQRDNGGAQRFREREVRGGLMQRVPV